MSRGIFSPGLRKKIRDWVDSNVSRPDTRQQVSVWQDPVDDRTWWRKFCGAPVSEGRWETVSCLLNWDNSQWKVYRAELDFSRRAIVLSLTISSHREGGETISRDHRSELSLDDLGVIPFTMEEAFVLGNFADCIEEERVVFGAGLPSSSSNALGGALFLGLPGELKSARANFCAALAADDRRGS